MDLLGRNPVMGRAKAGLFLRRTTRSVLSVALQVKAHAMVLTRIDVMMDWKNTIRLDKNPYVCALILDALDPDLALRMP